MQVRRSQIFLAAALLLAALLGAGVLWQFRDQLDRERLLALVESFAAMGPWVFFGLMAVLPLFWIPVSPFLLLAPAFGMPVAIAGSWAALSVNMVVAWFISGKWFRPLFVRLVTRFGYSIPVVSSKGMVAFAVLLRITPGMPFPLQNYLLGLARMPLGKYLLVSLPLVWMISASLLLVGGSIMKGSAALALLGIALAVAVALGLRWWRGNLQAKATLEHGS